jgi:hypothetical protein
MPYHQPGSQPELQVRKVNMVLIYLWPHLSREVPSMRKDKGQKILQDHFLLRSSLSRHHIFPEGICKLHSLFQHTTVACLTLLQVSAAFSQLQTVICLTKYLNSCL